MNNNIYIYIYYMYIYIYIPPPGHAHPQGPADGPTASAVAFTRGRPVAGPADGPRAHGSSSGPQVVGGPPQALQTTRGPPIEYLIQYMIIIDSTNTCFINRVASMPF